ncbi:MAG: tripartite tricarboxylate transporter substrate-binding protein [Alphaproteobacteria bacterium]|nr:tripartite tricarboxylate transporter substrate-binding protein [Alphaproteobacteria bacterium]
MRNQGVLVGGCAVLIGLGGAVQAQAADGAAFYNGKTATWIVTSDPGGGHDFWGRLMARHTEKALPGSKFVVQNRPGAGHILGLNLIYGAKANGLTMGNFSTGVALAQILGRKGMRADLTKMSWLVKLASEPRTMIAGKDSPYKTFEDVLNAKKVLRFSASGVGSGSYMDSFMLATSFGIPHKIITGYSGSQAPLAMMRGEIDLWLGSEDSAEAYVRSGRVRVIGQVGGNIKGVQDIRNFAKTDQAKAVTRLMYSMGQLSRIAAGPPNIPADRLKALRAAVKTAVTSKAFQDDAARAKRATEPAFGEDVHKLVVEMIRQPPEIVAMMKKLEKIEVKMLRHVGPVTQIKRGGRQIFIKHKGEEVSTKISGSRTKVIINGKAGKRKAIKVGMTCTFTYPRPGAESQRVDCRG